MPEQGKANSVVRVLRAARQVRNTNNRWMDTLGDITAAKMIGTFKGSAAEFVCLPRPAIQLESNTSLSVRDFFSLPQLTVSPLPNVTMSKTSVDKLLRIPQFLRDSTSRTRVNYRHLGNCGLRVSNLILGGLHIGKLSLASVGAQRGRGEYPGPWCCTGCKWLK